MRALAGRAKWERERRACPSRTILRDARERCRRRTCAILDRSDDFRARRADARGDLYAGPTRCTARSARPARSRSSRTAALTVWTHTQGVYPAARRDRRDAAAAARDKCAASTSRARAATATTAPTMPAADAALIARALPGRPVRVQWMREQEHAWEPYGPAMVTKSQRRARRATARSPPGNTTVWSNTHSTRPGGAGGAAGRASSGASRSRRAGAKADAAARRRRRPQRRSRSTRFPNAHVMHHFIPEMPLRVSALRALGAYMNVFSIESFMDELALLAGADPVDFRLRHLDDPRGRDVVDAPRRSVSAGTAATSRRRAAAAASPSRATRTSPPTARSRWRSR